MRKKHRGKGKLTEAKAPDGKPGSDFENTITKRENERDQGKDDEKRGGKRKGKRKAKRSMRR